MVLSYSITYDIFPENIISPEELLDLYFYGVPIIDKFGNTFSRETIKTFISAAQQEVEKYLNIKLQKQIIEETRDYVFDDWVNWGYLRVSYPVTEIFSLIGYASSVQQMNIPIDWLSVRKDNQEQYFRQIHVVPIYLKDIAALQGNSIYNGAIPLGFYMNKSIPNYWEILYCTGFSKIPYDLLDFIGKMAAVNLFAIMGDLILGAGIANQSIGIDGISQSIGTTSSATNAGYGARIQGYLQDLKVGWPKIYNYYKGFTVSSF